MIRVLVVDDEELMRAGLRLILDTADDMDVVAEARDGKEALAICRAKEVDVVLLDVRMAGGDGLTAAADITRLAPRTRVLMLTTFDDEDAVTRALSAGAAGFLLKDTGPNELLHAVRAAARDEQVLAPQVLRRLVRRHLTAPDRQAAARARLQVLTPAEADVLRVLAEGASNEEISQRLYLSVGTTKAHISRILHKLGCDNRVQAALIAHTALSG